MSFTRTTKKQNCFGMYFNTSIGGGGKPVYRFDQKAPEEVAELEELRSWNHGLDFIKILSSKGEKHACCNRLSMILP
jgi:hypothetical protein